jgi:aryl-alcohol dehydrogenase-like predicted oxidoreductase
VGTFRIGGELEVNRLGYGAMQLCGPHVTGWPEDRENALRVLRRAVELGATLVDTADAYGPEVNELQVAEALYPYEGIVVATKGGLTRHDDLQRGEWPRDGRPEHLRAACEGSLRRLRVDRIDLYQLHRPDPKVPFAESIGALRDLRDEGKIRHVGVSNVSLSQLEEARGIVEIASVQNEYNLGNRGSEDVFAACEQAGIAFLPWYPLDAGDLADAGGPVEAIARQRGATPAQIALAWLLQRSAVTIPIPGTSSLAHLEENMAAGGFELTDAELDRLGR